MTIFEYLKSPHPWLDTGNYTIWQIGLFFVGSVCWLACYADTLYDIRKKQTINIPVVAVCLNFGWEISTSLFFVPNMGKLLVAAYWGWMLLDTFIFISVFRYGFKQMQVKFFIKNSHFFIGCGIVISFLAQAAFITQYDLPMAPISGYIINLPMSIAFVYLLFVPGYTGNSKLTAWTKFLGTGLVSIMFFTKYPGNYFLTVMYIAVAFFDVLYICLLYKMEKAVLTNGTGHRKLTADPGGPVKPGLTANF